MHTRDLWFATRSGSSVDWSAGPEGNGSKKLRLCLACSIGTLLSFVAAIGAQSPAQERRLSAAPLPAPVPLWPEDKLRAWVDANYTRIPLQKRRQWLAHWYRAEHDPFVFLCSDGSRCVCRRGVFAVSVGTAHEVAFVSVCSLLLFTRR